MPSQEKLDLHFLSVGLLTSYNLSKDPSSKAGCVIVSPDGKDIVSTGYNGFPAGMPETEDLWERPTKYKYVIHSEANALLHAPYTLNCMAYVSWQPCNSCMSLIVASGIKRLVYYQYHPKYSDGKWPQTDQALFDSFTSRMEVVVIPKNDLLEGIRSLYPKLEGE